MEELNPELESFRQQWRAEVSARSKVDESKAQSKGSAAQPPKRKQPTPSRLATGGAAAENNKDDDTIRDIPTLRGADGGVSSSAAHTEDVGGFSGIREPRSALEHYEKAVEKESQGSLGDSLNLYRKAFRVWTQSCFSESALTISYRWTAKWTRNIRANIFRRRISLRNSIILIHQMRSKRYLLLPTTL